MPDRATRPVRRAHRRAPPSAGISRSLTLALVAAVGTALLTATAADGIALRTAAADGPTASARTTVSERREVPTAAASVMAARQATPTPPTAAPAPTLQPAPLVPASLRQPTAIPAPLAPPLAPATPTVTPPPVRTATPQPATPTVAPRAATPQRASAWIWPITGPLSSYFGPTHPLGIDIDLYGRAGAPIVAARAGTVVFAGGNACCSYGYYVDVDHGDGYKTRYAHFQAPPPVKIGQRVERGQVVGYAGTTGYSTGVHLHFEILRNGAPVNPLGLLP